MKVHEIVESPQFASDTQFWLTKPEINKELSDEVLSDNSLVELKNFDGATLYKTDNNYALIDDIDKSVIYVVEYDHQTVFGYKVVVQTKLWSDITDIRTKGIAAKVFKEYILPTTGVVMTDELQTQHGYRFWGSLIASLIKSHHIYAIDINSKNIFKIDISNFKNIMNGGGIWGDTKQYRTKRVLISTSELK